jgi:uncharacterized protein YqgV (UPF0045/DUF77 family)
MTTIHIDMTRYFQLVKEENEYLIESGFSRRYVEDFVKDKKEDY